MEITIKTGTVFIKEGALLPEALDASCEAFVAGWRAFANLDGYTLAKKIEVQNWHFFSSPANGGQASWAVTGRPHCNER